MLGVFFFFKQKTAYEMRISDWSSDVCSSDLRLAFDTRRRRRLRPDGGSGDRKGQARRIPGDLGRRDRRLAEAVAADSRSGLAPAVEIGRASCRERVCQYV